MDKGLNSIFKPKPMKEIYGEVKRKPTSRNYILWAKAKKLCKNGN
jgi:hypothetical protein